MNISEYAEQLRQKDEISDAQIGTYVDNILEDMFICTRDWSAWEHGTMTEDDFLIASEDKNVVSDITDIVIQIREEVDTKAVKERSILIEALEGIKLGQGHYSKDPSTHASNTIDDMIKIASDALSLLSHPDHWLDAEWKEIQENDAKILTASASKLCASEI